MPRDSATDDLTASFGEIASTFALPPVAMLEVPMWLPRLIVPQASGKPPKKIRVSVPGGVPATMRNTFVGTYVAAHVHMTTIGADGIGLVLGAAVQDGRIVAGIDLDACRDPISGQIEPWALDVIKLVRSHTQVSFSGRGVKIFATIAAADIPAIESAIAISKNHAQGASRDCCIWSWKSDEAHGAELAFYKSKRFFDFTGRHLTGTPIEFRQIDLDTILHLIRVVGPAFAALDPGRAKPTIPAGPSTPHPAPTNDNVGIDSRHPATDLWARIKAAAEKHPELRKRLRGDFTGLEDQSRSTIAFALGGALKRAGFEFQEIVQALHDFGATSSWAAEQDDLDGRGFGRIWLNAGEAPPRPDPHVIGYVAPPASPMTGEAPTKRALMTRLTRHELKNRPPRKWHYPGYFLERGIGFLSGDPETFKTFGALALAVPMALGEPFADLDFESGRGPGLVSIWLGEGADDVDPRVSAIENYYGFDEVQTLEVLTGTFSVDEVIAFYRGCGLRMLIVDTFARLCGGAGFDENSTKDVSVAMHGLERLKDELGCLILVIHHFGKDGSRGMRGSTALDGAADTVYFSTVKPTGHVIWTCDKMRSGPKPPPLVFELKQAEGSALLVPSRSPISFGPDIPLPPKGEAELLLMEILHSLMPTGRPPVPTPREMAPLPANVMDAALASNAVLVSTLRDHFAMRHPGATRATTAQRFKRTLDKLEHKHQILIIGKFARPMPAPLLLPAKEGA